MSVAERTRDRLTKLAAFMLVMTATVAVPDTALADTPPQIRLTGGSALLDGWLSGSLRTVEVRAQDDVGVSRVEVWLDHVLHDWRDNPSATAVFDATMGVFGTRVNDGPHRLEVVAYDTSGLRSPVVEGQSTRQIRTDNTPPGAPRELTVEGGKGWRSTNRFRVSWTNPVEQFAPVARVAYALCPAANPLADMNACLVTSRSRQAGVSELADLEVPKPGAWWLWVWLVDDAENHTPNNGTGISPLGFDPDPPELAFLEQDPQDPARLRVRARDATSSVARGEIEIRRRGQASWRSLPTEMGGSGFSAFADDSRLPRGIYDARARAFDEAGNERSTDRLEGGQPTTITLPVRIKARLAVGKVKRIRARRVLVARPQARYGQSVRLHGRLTTPGAKPVVDAEIEVSEQVRLAGAGWRRIGAVRTSRTGRFTFRARGGPSRVLSFRYAGTSTVRAQTADVDLRVRAGTSFRVNQRHVVNGEEVTFRGWLKGRPLPSTSKLVQLQVYSRRRWSTFAIARANPRSGVWSYRYRFEATRGRVRYRFRARVPQESGYPYATGTSQRVRVTVRGL
jgi:hypothetical protein